jgi:hypothetical protein
LLPVTIKDPDDNLLVTVIIKNKSSHPWEEKDKKKAVSGETGNGQKSAKGKGWEP